MPILLLSSMAFIFGCHFGTNSPKEVSSQNTKESAPWSLNPIAAVDDSTAIMYKTSGGRSQEIARVRSHQCGKEGGMQTWEVKLSSPFAAHLVTFEFSNDPSNKGVTAQIEDRKILISSSNSFSGELISHVCQDLKSKKSGIEVGEQEVEAILSQWLAMLAPDCEIENQNGQFRCNLGAVDALSAEETLNELRRTMVRSWSRQPYILTRRLSVAITLAQSLQAKDLEKQLDTLCRIVSHADPVELPLALANRRWQDSVCYEKTLDRKLAANIGLQKSVGEIEFLRQLFERTSKLGNLTIRIPREIAPTKDLWINLTPSSDVASNLASESQSLGAKMSASIDGDFESPKACWHPLFAVDYNSMQIARYLDLTGETRGISCLEQSTSKESLNALPNNYLAESITSETEFVMTNGHSKMLRLPAGSYSYEIRGHLDSLGWEPGAEETHTTGQITWSSKHPSVTIKSW